MLTTALHMDSSSTSPPPWLPVLAGNHHHNHQLLHKSTPASPSRQSSSHHHLLPLHAAPSSSARNNNHIITKKRRSRPSRRLPTTYINADPASFRRMVQQVTGAEDDLPPQPNDNNAADELLLTRPAPVKVSRTTGTDMVLPTLDTSAFLLGALSSCDGSASSVVAAPALKVMEAGGGAACNSSTAGSGFPNLESWDHHRAPLFSTQRA